MDFLYLQNGEIVLKSAVSINNSAFLYGVGLFETLRTHQKQFTYLNQHLNRLAWSATYLNLALPEESELNLWASKLLPKAPWSGESLLKIHVSNKLSHPFGTLGVSSDSEVVMMLGPLPQIPERLKLLTHKEPVLVSPFNSIKHSSRLFYMLAKSLAAERQVDDLLLTNKEGHIIETPRFNIFWIDQKGLLHTPPAFLIPMAGLEKERLVKLLKHKKINLAESLILAKDLAHAREVFATNSISGLVPVTEIDGKTISGGEAGDVTLMLQDLLKQELQFKLDTDATTH